MGSLIRRLYYLVFCRHTFMWHETIYGDEINLMGCREVWRCPKCGKLETRRHL